MKECYPITLPKSLEKLKGIQSLMQKLEQAEIASRYLAKLP
ncbi:MAG: hypothetical protein QW291_04180 [Thermofilaceae archaeon]